jgi:hypothetical protein
LDQNTIRTATKEDLIQYCQDELGFNPHPNIGLDTLISRVEEVWKGQGRTPQSVPVAKIGETKDGEKWLRIILHNTSLESNRPQPVSVQGYTITIPRNVEVDVPARFVESLDHAIMNVVHPETKEQIEVRRFPYTTVIADVTPEQRKELKSKIRKKEAA